MGLMEEFRCLVIVPKGRPAKAMIRAAQKAGAVAFVSADDLPALDTAAGPFGLVVDAGLSVTTDQRISAVMAPAEAFAANMAEAKALRARGLTLYAEVTRCDQAALSLEGIVDAFVLKGHECAGLVSEQTTFILLQEFRRKTALPLIARGGITPETAAAAHVGGASGVVLDDQIMLLAESPLQTTGRDATLRRRLQTFSGSETLQVELTGGVHYLRGLDQPGAKSAEGVEARLAAGEAATDIAAGFSWAPGAEIAPGGQGLALAAAMARRFRTLGKLITRIRQAVATLPAAAARRGALAEGGALARTLGLRYPIFQGPMTRVSDVAAFSLKVAEGGALPFSALALLSGETTEKLLTETRDLLGDRPWGVGMLGFVDSAILKPQMEVVDRIRPKFALIAGGRINQIMEFEAKGIATFTHAATPSILAHYLDEGVRRFIVEGRECGGHVGPLSSFALWASICETLAVHPAGQKDARRIQVVFAGGIHDAVSAAMVATLAEPIAAMGVEIGVLMGTGYLYTREIVESGAIVPDYQAVALGCMETRCLWEGPGFASRCAVTPIVEEFTATREKLKAEGAPVPKLREALEHLSLGRLRMATKGLARTGEDKALTEIGPEQRQREGMYMIGQVAALQEGVRSIAEFHAEVADGSVAYLRDWADDRPAAKPVAPKPADIAIVGMATLLPGSDTLSAYWRRIVTGQSAIRAIPEDRWSLVTYHDADRKARDKIYSQRGGFLTDVAFNPMDYGIPPGTLGSVDPMQFLALELVKDVLADATGGATEALDRARTSVIFGFSGGMGEKGAQYVARSELPRLLGDVPAELLDQLPEWTEDSFAGILPNVSAGRVANRFDFGGSNAVIDAACASSLAAVYSAVMELETGRADTVVAGGVDSLQSPFGYLCFSKTQALSPRGVCNTFDKKADGIVISEGLAAVVLKRLADAERDGDRIYGVIKGVGASSDGRAKGLTAPLPAGQKRALDRAYAQAGFAPSAVELFEAHGTGTVAGDKAELETVVSTLKAHGARAGQAAIGSVKTLIGHTKASAGIAGLIKVTLGLHHKVLPPHALVEDPNSVFEDDSAPVHLSQVARPWVPAPGNKRRAGVSAFGFGGTNYHVALEEYDAPDQPVTARADTGVDHLPFAMAAADAPALKAAVDKLAAVRALSLRDLAERVQPGKGPARLGFVASTLDEAKKKLAVAAEALARGQTQADGVNLSLAPRLMAGQKLAFLFPGQGSQYPGMLRQVVMSDADALQSLTAAETALESAPSVGGAGKLLSRLIWPRDAFTPEAKKVQMAALTATEIAQPALGAVEAALLSVVSKAGARPDMVAGHSYGEFVALHAAGAFDLPALIRLSEARGRAMVENGDPNRPGGMAAVAADAEATAKAIAGVDDVVIANLNSPRQTVIAGPRAAIDKAMAAVEKAGLQVTSVPVSQAFHSPLMAAARTQFDRELASVDWKATDIAVYSNTLGRAHPTGADAQRKIMGEHLVSPVDFTGMIRTMVADGAGVFVEVGPKSVLSGRISEILGKDVVRSIALDRSSGDFAALLEGLVQLWTEGADLDFAALTAGLAEVSARPSRSDEKNIWYLNGAYVRRSDEPLRDVTPPERAALQPVPAPTAQAHVTTGNAPAAFGAAPTPSAATVPTVSAHHPEELEFMYISDDDLRRGVAAPPGQGDALTDHHALMREFLRMQENVMLAWLNSGASAPVISPQALAATPVAARPALPSVAMPAPTAFAMPPVAAAPVHAPAPAPAPVAAPVAAPAPVAAAPAPVAAAPVAAAAPVDLMSAFLTIVAEKTGYPEDALDADQGMEADLGIDSIKRMEILGALQKILPEAAGQAMRARMSEITELASIRQIVTFIDSQIGTGGPAPAAAGAAGPFELTGTENSEGAADLAVLSRYLQIPFAEDAGHVPSDLPKGFETLVSEAEDGLHLDVTKALEAQGANVRLIPRSALSSDEALRAFAAGLSPRPKGLVWLESRAALPDFAAMDLATFKAIQDAQTKRFFTLLQALAADLQDGGRVIAAMEMGGLFGRVATGAGLPVSAGAGALGILKALALEWRACSSKVIDLDHTEPPAARAAHLASELSFLRGRREAGYPAGQRTILRTEAAALSPPRGPLSTPTRDWVVLATGGARGITAECLRTVAPFGPRLVLVGRSALPAFEGDDTASLDLAGLRRHYLDLARASGEKPRPAAIETQIVRHLANRDMSRNVADLTAMGATVDYRIADVADPAAMGGLIEALYAEFGRIDMVVHGAGLIEDTLLENKTRESFDRVFDAKVDSAFILARHLRPDTLKGLCFFTSVAGRYGNRGQTDYAAANETLNRLAWSLQRQWPMARIKAINWGPWGATTTGAGMVTEPVRQQFLSRGIGMVEAKPGRDFFFNDMFWAPEGQVEVVGWEADGETMEAAECDLPVRQGEERLGGNLTLLQNARRTADGGLLWRYDMVNAPYVDHHRFDGHAVMPAAAVLQMFAELPRALGDDRPVIRLENVQILKGLTLEDGPFDARLDLAPPDAEGRRQATIRAVSDPKRVRFRADLVFGQIAAIAALPRAAEPAAAWTGLDVASMYRRWLSHGPRYQSLLQVTELSHKLVTASAQRSTPSEFVPAPADRAWEFDPSLIDGVLQLVWIWARAVQGASALPLSFKSVSRFAGDANATPLRIEVTILTPPDSAEVTSNSRVFNARGELVYVVEAFTGQSTPRLNRLGGGWPGGLRETTGNKADALETAE